MYPCNNKPRPVPGKRLMVQDGWYYQNDTRHPKMVMISNPMSTNCMYDASHKDTKCSGCKHIRSQNG